ncbi:MAG: hypothetical protein C0503_08095 [Gemmatimonas sp.]|nr:hypothetical protein [Gemmatimonas sp.]
MPRLLALAGLSLLVACAPSAVRSRDTPAPRAEPLVAPDSLAGPWRFRTLGRPRSQLVTLSAVLQSRVDSVVREDTLASQALLEWSLVPDAAPARVVGMVRGFSVIVGSDSTWRPLPELAMPVSFAAAQLAPGLQPTFTMPADTACHARAAVVQALRETWVAPPARVARGSTWRDSAEYPLCRDGILLRVRSVRQFTVEDAVARDGQLALRVRRESTSSLSGEGLQFGDSIHVTGAGQATALLELSLDGAAILVGEGSSELRLQLKGRRRTQDLVQHGALIIRTP